MTSKDTEKPGSAGADRKERLSEALRANLKRRKAQARARKADEAAAPAKPEDDAEPAR